MTSYYYYKSTQLSIRLLTKGCTNRPFYHIIVAPLDRPCKEDGIEQLGVYDPMPNERDEQLVAVNMDRFKHYVAQGAWVRDSVASLLGAAGVWPIHPRSLAFAWRNRQKEWKLNNPDS